MDQGEQKHQNPAQEETNRESPGLKTMRNSNVSTMLVSTTEVSTAFPPKKYLTKGNDNQE